MGINQLTTELTCQATIGIANLLSSLDSDHPTILRELNSIEHKIDQLLKS